MGRDLAVIDGYKDLDDVELFKYVKEKCYLITDAEKVYEFFGVTDYITNIHNWSVLVDWDLTNDNVTFIKGKGHNEERLTLKIGPESYEKHKK